MNPGIALFIPLSLFFSLFTTLAETPGPQDVPETLKNADAAYAKGSYAEASRLYSTALESKLSGDRSQWARFRQSDSRWREQASGDPDGDKSQSQQARIELQRQAEDLAKSDKAPEWLCEVWISLGDYEKTANPDYYDWGHPFEFYLKSLQWMEKQNRSEALRKRYLQVVMKALERDRKNEPYLETQAYWPLPICENAVTLARTQDEQSATALLLALALHQNGAWQYPAGHERIRRAYVQAILSGKASKWYDDALWSAAIFAESYGRLIESDPGQYRAVPDYPEAMKLLQRLQSEFKKGESSYFEQAGQRLGNIQNPSLQLYAGSAFLPSSPIELNLNTRNVDSVQIRIRKLDLAKHFEVKNLTSTEFYKWRNESKSSAGTGEIVREWKIETKPEFDRMPFSKTEKTPPLPAGAYWVEMQSGSVQTGTILLVTETALNVQDAGGKVLAFVCDAMSGKPKQAQVQLLVYSGKSESVSSKTVSATTDADGVAWIQWEKNSNESQYGNIALALADGQPALVRNLNIDYYRQEPNQGRNHKVYLFTDRPAYRPGEKVNFKLIDRVKTPQGFELLKTGRIHAVVNDPRGEKLFDQEFQLNDFGTAAGEFVMPKDAPLGEYRIELRVTKNGDYIGQQILFRLEEYKLPEFRVSVKTPEKNGTPLTFRSGEKIQAEVGVEYHSGGSIPDAEVEYTIYQKQLTQENPWPQPYPWLYRNLQSSVSWMRFWRDNYNDEQVVRQDKTKTDSKGKAVIEFQSPQGAYDLEFRIEAKVTDASHREVTGSGSVKVTRQAFALHLKPEAQLYRPGDTVEMQVKALDPNGNSITSSATLFITRERYVERKAVSKKTGKERVIFQGYESETVEERNVEIQESGPVKVSFKVPKEGFYRIKLLAPALPKQTESTQRKAVSKTPADRIMGEAGIFVCTNETRDLGYRLGSLQLFPQKPSYRAGETARVVVVMPEDGRTALLTMEGRELLQHKVLRMAGTVQVVEFPVTEASQPNVFINALSVYKGQVMTDTEELVVPPEEHFLTVNVLPGNKQIRPGEKNQLTIEVRDSDGKPAKAELALGVADASIYYIQAELAGDIREFYFGQKNNYRGQPRSMLNELQVREVAEPEGEDILEIEKSKWNRGGVALNEENRQTRFNPQILWQEDEEEGLLMADQLQMAQEAIQLDSASAYPRSQGRSMMARGKVAMAYASASLAEAAKSPAPGRRYDKKEMKALASMQKASGDLEMVSDEANDQPNIIVRSDFRSTAFWKPSIITDSDGKAIVDVDYPQSLTEWKATARAVTAGMQIGMGESTTKTSLPLSTRLQSPRFLVEGDESDISAILNNLGSSTLNATADILINGAAGALQPGNKISLTPGKQQRLSTRYTANKTGNLELQTSVKSGRESDAMKLSIPVIEHGIDKASVRSNVWDLSGDRKVKGVLNLPLPLHREGSAKLEIWLTPSMASTCLDALPYLAQFPYGCVEQTMSRFLPSAIAARTLDDLGLDASEVEKRIFGGIEPSTPFKIPGATTQGKKGNLRQLDEMISAGMARLKDMHHDDGGWGWWKQDKTDDFMTAYVVWGLAVAGEAGRAEGRSEAESGATYLRQRLVNYENEPDMAAWLLHAISAHKSVEWNKNCQKSVDNLLEQQDKLNPYTRSLLALTLQARRSSNSGYEEKAKLLVKNLENGIKIVKQDSALIGASASATGQDTCHWGNAGVHYRWSDGGVESTAFALKAILAIDPANKRADEAARWLVLNRRGAQWKNTRDTAIVLLALTDYMKIKKETSPDLKAAILVNGKKIQDKKFTGKDALGLMKIEVPESMLKEGDNQVEINMEGKGRLYGTANLSYFSKEVPIPASGNELYVKREYYREHSVPRLLQGINIERSLLKDGDVLESGDSVEVRLLIEAKNNFEYLMVEDKRPAGCEASEVRSGEPVYATKKLANGKFEGPQTFVYQELRDQHSAFFITRMEEGIHEIRYKLRAETPGHFHALPTVAEAMYVPEIRGNGDEVRLTIKEAIPAP